MIRALKEALAQCLARLEAGANIEDCLRDQGSLAAELRPLLEAARALHVQGGRIPEHTPAALQRGLTREQRQVLVLRHIEGHTSASAGEIMGKKDNAIRALEFRALASLRRAMSRSERTGEGS